MAYSALTFKDLTDKLGLELQGTHLFSAIKPIQPSSWLIETLKKSTKLGFINEKERSERVISPILTEISELSAYKFIIYSGRSLDIDESRNLNGECDFIFSFGTVIEVLQAPFFSIVEAKKENIDGGTVQCAGQLFAANIFNQQNGKNIKTLYGCTTTGEVWRFMKLENNILYLDEDRYYITQLDLLLAVFHQIVENSRQNLG
jgi:hypothetical protein